jgi:hypothetical protein
MKQFLTLLFSISLFALAATSVSFVSAQTEVFPIDSDCGETCETTTLPQEISEADNEIFQEENVEMVSTNIALGYSMILIGLGFLIMNVQISSLSEKKYIK